MILISKPEIIEFPSGGKSYRWEPGDGTRYQAILVETPPEGLLIGGAMGGLDGPGYLVTWGLTGKTILLPGDSCYSDWALEELGISNVCSQFQCLLFLHLYAKSYFGLELIKRAEELFTSGHYPLEALGPLAPRISKTKVPT